MALKKFSCNAGVRSAPLALVALTLASGAAVLACGAGAGEGESGSAGATAALEARLSTELADAIGGAFQVEVSAELGNVRHLEGRVPVAQLVGVTATERAFGFLAQHPRLLELGDPARSLAVMSDQSSESGRHVRMQQVVGGVPVRGGELIVHFNHAGDLVAMDARVVAPALVARVELTPAVGAPAAADRAVAELLARVPELAPADLRAGGVPELVVFAEPGRAPKLAWHHVVRAMSRTTAAVLDITLDARTLEVLEAFDDLETLKATSAGVLGDMKTFEVTDNGGGNFTLVDKSRAAEIRTYTAATSQTLPGTVCASNSQNSWDNVAKGKGAAVDAHFFAGFVYDYYKTRFGRNGIDGRNSPMVSTAHFGANYENAFWDGTQMAYGDGAVRFKALSAGLDVVAHEFTHGVTTSTSNLQYQGQPGALNEAISDIFSTFIEHTYKPDDRNNWLTGETIGTAIRDLMNPKAKGQPSHMKEFVNTQQDNGGVHINSGIPNNAAYLMTMGGQNPYSKVEVGAKLGWEKSEKLWYEIETKYLTSRSDFKAAATASMTAAKALGFSEVEQAVVQCAWVAVGVLPAPCDPAAAKPVPTLPEAGPLPTPEPGSPTTDGGGASGGQDAGAAPRPPAQGLLGAARDDSGCSASPRAAGNPVAALAGVLFGLAALVRRRRSR